MGIINNIKSGLIGRIKNLISKGGQDIGGVDGISQEKHSSGDTTEIGRHGDESEGTGAGDFYYKKMIVERTRLASYVDYELMDAEHPELSSSLDVYSDVAVAGEESEDQRFAIDSEDDKVKEVLQDINKRTRIDQELWPLTRDLCKYGDEFEEIVVSSAGLIVRLKSLPQNEMFRNEDKYGLLLEERAFEQKDTLTTKVLAQFEPWQIAHFRNRTSRKGQYGSSIFSPARRLFKQLQMMEDGMIVGRLARSHMRYVYKIDVGELPPPEAEAHVESVKRRIKKKRRLNPITGKFDVTSNPLSAEEDMFVGVRTGSQAGITKLEGASRLDAIKDVEYFQNKMFTVVKVPKSYLGLEKDVCLAGETKISLLDGREVAIKDLVEMYPDGKKFYVYSIGPDNVMSVGVAHSARPTRRNAEMVKVVLDNGESVRCTPDHLWMRRDGTYVMAKNLRPDDSLMPLYRKVSEKGKNPIYGYEMYKNPRRGAWCYTHRMVGKWLGRPEFPDWTYGVQHHADFNKRNNCPTNIEWMEFWDHLKLHQDNVHRLNTPEMKARARIGIINSEKFKKRLLEWNKCEEKREICKQAMLKYHQENDFTGENNPNYKTELTLEKIMKMVKEACCLNRYDMEKQFKITYPLLISRLKKEGMSYKEFANQCFIYGWQHKGNLFNDIPMEGIIDQTREGMPLKKIAKSFECSIDTIRRICHDHDVDNFKDLKEAPFNHKVVSVEPDGMDDITYDITVEGLNNFALSVGVFVHNSSKALLSNQDIQFLRTIRRIQHVTLKNGLKKIYDVGLLLQGYDLTKAKYEILFPSVKTADEVRKWEIEKAKAEAAKIYGLDLNVVTDDFILSYFLGLSDEEIKDLNIVREKETEKAKKAADVEAAAQIAKAQAAIKAGGKAEDTINLMRTLNELKDVVAMELEGKKYNRLIE